MRKHHGEAITTTSRYVATHSVCELSFVALRVRDIGVTGMLWKFLSEGADGVSQIRRVEVKHPSRS